MSFLLSADCNQGSRHQQPSQEAFDQQVLERKNYAGVLQTRYVEGTCVGTIDIHGVRLEGKYSFHVYNFCLF